MPVIAAIPAVLASVGTAVGASAAAATTVGALVVGGTAAAIYSGVSSSQQAAAAKKAAANQASNTPNAGQVVGGDITKTADANRLGRAALISTSPSGVSGLDPTGRRRLLGND